MVRNLDLLTGRFFDATEVRNAQHVALPTEKLARRLFGSQAAAIGQNGEAARAAVHHHRNVQRKSIDLRPATELSGDNILIPITVLKYFTQIERIDPLYVEVAIRRAWSRRPKWCRPFSRAGIARARTIT